MKFFFQIIISTLAVMITAWLVPGVSVESPVTALFVAIVIAFLNNFLKPVMILLTIPVTVFTLGLFLLVINACLILLTSSLVQGFVVEGFGWAVLFSILLSFTTSILSGVKVQKEEHKD